LVNNKNNYRKNNRGEERPRDPPVKFWPLPKHELHVVTNVRQACKTNQRYL
jgi:hypothetical protein